MLQAENQQSSDSVLYELFLQTRQESQRLSAALAGFFLTDGVQQAHHDAYRAYLKRRIRPAAAALIEAEDTEKLEILAAQGWFDRALLDDLILTARQRRKPAALVWLLRRKQAAYGFCDRDFSL